MLAKLRAASKSLWLILAVAFCARLGFAWYVQQHNSRQALATIPFLFESGNIAHSLATGNGFGSPFLVDTGPTAWMTPAYPLLLAGIFRILGNYTFSSYIAAVLLNIVCSALACVPIYFAGKHIGGIGVAAGAAWLWAIFPNAIQLAVESMWDASLAALLAGTILWATLVVAESRRARDWCAYGLLWGLALMTNAALASLLPFLLGWMAYRAWRRGEQWLRNSALAAGIVVLCCVPWTVRNYAVFHSFVPLRSTLGLQLFMGNNPQAREVWLGDLHPIFNSAERQKYMDMGEVAYMREKQRDAIQFMLAHPRREVRLIAYRFVSIWTGGEPHPLRYFLRVRSLWLRGVLLFNIIFAAVGTCLCILMLVRARSIYAFPLAVFPVVFPCAYYLTLALPRYRLPIDPILMLLAAIGIAALASAKSGAGSAPAANSRAARALPAVRVR